MYRHDDMRVYLFYCNYSGHMTKAENVQGKKKSMLHLLKRFWWNTRLVHSSPIVVSENLTCWESIVSAASLNSSNNLQIIPANKKFNCPFMKFIFTACDFHFSHKIRQLQVKFFFFFFSFFFLYIFSPLFPFHQHYIGHLQVVEFYFLFFFKGFCKCIEGLPHCLFGNLIGSWN